MLRASPNQPIMETMKYGESGCCIVLALAYRASSGQSYGRCSGRLYPSCTRSSSVVRGKRAAFTKMATSISGLTPMYRQNNARRREAIMCRASADPIDRALGSAPYLLPLFDGLKYGTYIFNAYPAFARLLGPLFPLYQVYTAVPFSSTIAFFGLYFGVARNPRLTRFVRFNTMQAVLMDILLLIPGIFQQLFKVSYEFRVPLYNVTWMYVFCCTAIGIGSCFVGRSVRLPLVADASDAQIG